MSEIELHKALIRAAKKIKNPTKNAKNPFLKNHYADLGAVIDATKQALMEEGIIVMQECQQRQGLILDVMTTFVHDSGASKTLVVSVHLKDVSPQGSMGAFTYGRRYGLLAGFNLAAQDDDANVASGKADEALSVPDVKQAASSLGNILKKGTK